MTRYLQWLPLFLFLLFTPFSAVLDLNVAHYFYDTQGHFVENAFTRFFYNYGEYFGFFVGGCACFFFAFSFLNQKWKKYRKGAAALILTLVLGAGILINLGFKEYWGRPRPKQLEEFGGNLQFRPFYEPNFSVDRAPQKSFPSGHAAMGFYYLTLLFIGRHTKNRTLFLLGLGLTLVCGVALVVTRVAQGGHFLSDTLASFVIMWYVGSWSTRLLFKPSQNPLLKDA